MNPSPKKKRKHRLPNFLFWPDAMRLLDWCRGATTTASARKRPAAVRDEIVVRVGLYLGLRVNEICNMDVADVDLVRRSALVREGKGGRDRVLRIPEKLIAALTTLIGERTSGVLIADGNGERLSDRTIRWRLDRAAKLAGLAVHVHPHILRHSYSTRFLDTGGNIRRLQALLGHANLQTTAKYLDLDVTRFAEDVDRL